MEFSKCCYSVYSNCCKRISHEKMGFGWNWTWLVTCISCHFRCLSKMCYSAVRLSLIFFIWVGLQQKMMYSRITLLRNYGRIFLCCACVSNEVQNDGSLLQDRSLMITTTYCSWLKMMMFLSFIDFWLIDLLYYSHDNHW